MSRNQNFKAVGDGDFALNICNGKATIYNLFYCHFVCLLRRNQRLLFAFFGTTLQASAQLKKSQKTRISGIENTLKNANTQDSLLLLAQRQEKLDSIRTVSQNIHALAAMEFTYRTSEADVLKQSYEDLSGNEQYEINERLVNEVYLSTIAKGIDTFTQAQKATLESLIWQCPLAGGSAVLDARSLYALVNDTLSFYDDSVCLAQGLNFRQIKQTENQINTLNLYSLYPNPTQNEVNIVFKNGLKEDTHLILYNSLGTVVYEAIIPKNRKEYSFSTVQLSQGVYSLSVSAPTVSYNATKLVIIR